MAKLNFIYIGKDWDGNPKTNLPTGEIKCIKVKLSDDKFHLVPIVPYTRWEKVEDVEEVWVRGKGWIKIANRKQYTIPAFDGTIEHFADYLNEYGDDVMCYCLNGDLFHRSGDCCDINYINEYRCLRHYGAEKFNDYTTHFNAMLDYQRKWFIEHHLPVFKEHGYGDKVVENWLFKPELNLGFSFMPVSIMSVDILHDDKLCEKLYMKLRYWELYEKHEQYPEYAKHKKVADKYKSEHESIRGDYEYEKLCEKCMEIDHIIHCDVEKQIKEELELPKGTPEFPQCFNDRVRILFGPDVRKEYDYLCNEFDPEKKEAA